MCKRELYLKFAGTLPEWDTEGFSNKDMVGLLDLNVFHLFQ